MVAINVVCFVVTKAKDKELNDLHTLLNNSPFINATINTIHKIEDRSIIPYSADRVGGDGFNLLCESFTVSPSFLTELISNQFEGYSLYCIQIEVTNQTKLYIIDFELVGDGYYVLHDSYYDKEHDKESIAIGDSVLAEYRIFIRGEKQYNLNEPFEYLKRFPLMLRLYTKHGCFYVKVA